MSPFYSKCRKAAIDLCDEFASKGKYINFAILHKSYGLLILACLSYGLIEEPKDRVKFTLLRGQDFDDFTQSMKKIRKRWSVLENLDLPVLDSMCNLDLHH